MLRTGVAVIVGVGVRVRVEIAVGVGVAVGVNVDVAVAIAVPVGVRVAVADGASMVGVRVIVGTAGVDVAVCTPVGDGLGVTVANVFELSRAINGRNVWRRGAARAVGQRQAALTRTRDTRRY
jgi:hypothetical protein